MDIQERLKDLETEFDYRKNGFVAAVRTGKLPIENILAYAQHAHWMAVGFPHRLARLLTICPTASVRAHVIANLAEEEGFMLGEGEGGVFRPDRRHVVFTERFLNAVKARCPGQEAESVPPALAWYEQAEKEGRWLACASYIFVGVEASIARAFPLLVAPFRRHYGFTNEELEHFILHITADKTHGEVGMRLILEHASTPELQAEAYDGARRGARVWWAVHSVFSRSREFGAAAA